jgi:hypothetical protein
MRLAEIASGALDRLGELREDPTQTKRVMAGASAARLVQRAQEIMSGTEIASGVSTGFSDLDDATSSYRPGTLWIGTGRLGMVDSDGRQAPGTRQFFHALPANQKSQQSSHPSPRYCRYERALSPLKRSSRQ